MAKSVKFLQLKIDFRKYLKNLNKQDDTKDKYDVSRGNNSIFKYTDEFSEFLKEYSQDGNSVDFSSQSLDFDKLEEFESADILSSLSDAKEVLDIESGDNNFILEIVRDLFKDDEFKDAMDENQDGKLDSGELKAFFEVTNNSDDDNKKASLADVFSGVNDIKNNDFKLGEVVHPTVSAVASAAAGGSSGSGGSGSVGSTGSTTSSTTNQANATTTQEENKAPVYDTTKYEGMNEEQLKAELEKTTQGKQQTQASLTNLLSGQPDAHPEVLNLKNTADTAYQAYLNTLDIDQETKTKAEELRNQSYEQYQLINDTIIQIQDNELQTQGVEAQITNINTSIEQIGAAINAASASLSALEASNGTEDENGNKIDNSAQIQALSAQIAALNEQKTQAEQQKTELEEQKNQLLEQAQALQEQYTQQETAYNEAALAYQEINAQLQEITDQLSQQFTDFNAAEVAYATAMDQTITAVAQEVLNYTNAADTINMQIANVRYEVKQEEQQQAQEEKQAQQEEVKKQEEQKAEEEKKDKDK